MGCAPDGVALYRSSQIRQAMCYIYVTEGVDVIGALYFGVFWEEDNNWIQRAFCLATIMSKIQMRGMNFILV